MNLIEKYNQYEAQVAAIYPIGLAEHLNSKQNGRFETAVAKKDELINQAITFGDEDLLTETCLKFKAFIRAEAERYTLWKSQQESEQVIQQLSLI